jgi:hypothetical protein
MQPHPVNGAGRFSRRVPNLSPNRKRAFVADSIKGKVKSTGDTVADTAKKVGEKVQAGADTVADKAADAAKATGSAVKRAGQKVKDKSGA